MGRAFEFRKERKMKRWGHMARTFTKLGKEITITVVTIAHKSMSATRTRS